MLHTFDSTKDLALQYQKRLQKLKESNSQPSEQVQ